MMKAAQEHPNSGTVPPNLVVTEDPYENCSTCANWAEGWCKLYGYRTQPNQTCDSWTPELTDRA
jgi:hypothetical protein